MWAHVIKKMTFELDLTGELNCKGKGMLCKRDIKHESRQVGRSPECWENRCGSIWLKLQGKWYAIEGGLGKQNLLVPLDIVTDEFPAAKVPKNLRKEN